MKFFASIVALLMWAGPSSTLGVMGIDFGTDWFKVAVVKPGIPLEVVLNKESKRKTETVLTIRNGIRYFGSDAISFGVKRPQDSYGKLKNLLGRLFDDPAAKEYRDLFDNTMLEDPVRKTVMFQHDANMTLSVEELIGMQLAHAKSQCEAYAEESIKDAVITVPPFWTQKERQALLDAADIAGLRVVGLINDETAVAINYAMTRTFDTPQYHLLYDMGAGSTVVALVEFKQVPAEGSKSKKDSVTSIEIKAIGYDRTLGGNSLDLKLQKFLLKQFESKYAGKTSKPISQSQRALAKLLREANRVKHILSANNECSSSVEGLFEEIDFKTKVTRNDMLGGADDFFERLKNPIDKVLEISGLNLSSIQSLILVGGGIRVPAVQTKLEEIVGADKIAKHVNADEAAVLGAAFRGAAISPAFRVKKILVKDVIPFPVSMSFKSDADEPVTQTLFSRFSPLDTKKKISFKKQADFEFGLDYASSAVKEDPQIGDNALFKVNVKGVEQALKKENATIKEKKIKALVHLTGSGMVELTRVEAELEMELEKSIGGKLADTVLSFFGGNGENKTDNATQTNQTQIEEQKQEEPKIKIETIPLKFSIVHGSLPPLDEQAKRTARSRLLKMDQEDLNRKKHDEARNNLEAFIYKSNEFLSSDGVADFSTTEERDKYSAEARATSDWLYEEVNDETPTSDILQKLKSLQKQYDDIYLRIQESKCRPDLVNALKKSIELADSFVFVNYTNVTEDQRLYDQADITRLTATVSLVDKWLKESLVKLDLAGRTSKPALLCSELKEKRTLVDKELLLTSRKKRLPSASTSSTTTTTSTTSTAFQSASTTPAFVTTQAVTTEPSTTQIPSQNPQGHDEL